MIRLKLRKKVFYLIKRISFDMSFQVAEPILIIGLGGAGAKLAVQAKEHINADVLAISNDQNDLQVETSIKVSTSPIINPTVQLIRGSAYDVHEEIRSKISNYSTIILMANLAGKAGAALAPTVSQICKKADKKTIAFAIMPFGYENNKIFNSGIALKRIKENSTCTVILDNDALLECNPGFSPNACFDIANKAILYVVHSLKTFEVNPETSILTTSAKSSDIEESLRNSLKMLYEDATPNSIKRSILYVVGGNDIPAGILSSIRNITRGFLDGSDAQMDLEQTSSESNLIMLSTVQNMAKFDNYDPLGIIPQDHTLDWSEPDTSIHCDIDLYQLE